MNEWRRLPVPPICERMIGFSVPCAGECLVISYEAVHLLHLGQDVTVESDDEFAEYDIYDSRSGTAKYRGKIYQIIGLHGGNPVLDGRHGEKLLLDTKSETLSVVQIGRTVFSTPYKNFSGDWAAATFSEDGRFIVLGCPYDFDFMVLERVG